MEVYFNYKENDIKHRFIKGIIKSKLFNIKEPLEEWFESRNKNEIHYYNSLGFHYWKVNDANGNCINYKDTDDTEEYAIYDSLNRIIEYRLNDNEIINYEYE